MNNDPVSNPHPKEGLADKPLLEVRDFALSFGGRSGARTPAVERVSLTVYPRQTVAVVGESGSGKSVTALSTLGLLPRPPARYDAGQIWFDSRDGRVDLLTLDEQRLQRIRGAQIAMIFQEPMTSLNPVYTIGEQIMEAVLLHRHASRAEARAIAIAALKDVAIKDPEKRLRAYPHEFSGGMRQRVMIAMALACKPRLLIADEPTTALDVTVQARILELLAGLRREREMSMLLITHALGVVAENADVVCVMYAGRVVEYATVTELFDHPLHPYTRGLLASIPRTEGRIDRLITIRDVVDNEGEFTALGGGLRPWWPRHSPPADAVAGSGPGGDSALVEVRSEHWVGVWRTPAAVQMGERPPALAFRVAPAVGVA